MLLFVLALGRWDMNAAKSKTQLCLWTAGSDGCLQTVFYPRVTSAGNKPVWKAAQGGPRGSAFWESRPCCLCRGWSAGTRRSPTLASWVSCSGKADATPSDQQTVLRTALGEVLRRTAAPLAGDERGGNVCQAASPTPTQGGSGSSPDFPSDKNRGTSSALILDH